MISLDTLFVVFGSSLLLTCCFGYALYRAYKFGKNNVANIYMDTKIDQRENFTKITKTSTNSQEKTNNFVEQPFMKLSLDDNPFEDLNTNKVVMPRLTLGFPEFDQLFPNEDKTKYGLPLNRVIGISADAGSGKVLWL